MSEGNPASDTESKCNKHVGSGWHLFSEQKPTEGSNVMIYYGNGEFVNTLWKDCILEGEGHKQMILWRACR